MALLGKLVGYVEISNKRDIFHDLLKHKPHELVAIVPHKYHDCMRVREEPLDQSSLGTTLTLIMVPKEGKKKIAKEIIESVDEENHTIVFKVIEGELVEIYKCFKIKFHVEPKGDCQVAAWTCEFDRSDTSAPYPTSEMDYLCELIKDLDAHNNATSNKENGRK